MTGRLLKVENWEHLAIKCDFRPATVASSCRVSLRTLERFFAQQFKKTPTEWSRELRCRVAVQLIIKGYSNKAVVAELKFANEAHLCHLFKKVYGVPPQSFVLARRF